MRKKSIAFLGTKEIGATCLQYLVDHKEDLGVEIRYVLTNNRSLGGKEKSVKSIAEANQLTCLHDLDAMVNEPKVDLLISVQYHTILKQKHIDSAVLAINFHMAPLPEYRGCNQFSFAIIDNKREFGTSVHIVNEGIDSGDLIDEIRFPIPAGIFVKDLYELTYEKTIELFTRSVPRILKNSYSTTSQNDLKEERGCSIHYRKEINELKKIDLQWPIEKQKRFFRATYFPPFSPPVGIENGKEIELSKDWFTSL